MSAIKRRAGGFSLTEMAIVLGIVSLILGGLWSAGRLVQQSQRVSETAKRVTLILHGLREVFGVYPAGAIDFSDASTLQGVLTANIIPSDMIGTPNDPSSLQHAWGSPFALSSSPCAGQAATSTECVALTFSDLPQGACLEFVTRLTGPDADSLFDSISNGSGVDYRTPPLDLATINSLCATDTGSQTLKLIYKLK